MTLSRRHLLGAAATTGLVSLAGCGGGGTGSGPVELRFGWWGSDRATELTHQAIERFNTTQTAIRVVGEPGPFTGYFDKLATQTAAGDAPDVIQMNLPFLREYADRGALLQLDDTAVDVSTFTEATRNDGRTDDGLFGVSTGINCAVMTANPQVLERASIALPDDTTWTWPQFVEVTTAVSAGSPAGIVGLAGLIVAGAPEVWIRQQGKQLFGPTGPGFDAADLQSLYELSQQLITTKASPSPTEMVESKAKALEESPFGTGNAGFSISWSNQGGVLDAATGSDIAMLRFPSITGRADGANLWYRASSLFSGSARTRHPEQVATFINYLINDVEAGRILKGDRGMPPNPTIREAIRPMLSAAEAKSYDFLASIEQEIGPTPPIPAAGGGSIGDIITRHGENHWFGRADAAGAAQAALAELSGQLG